MDWEEANKWEQDWHKDQQFNSYNEETKQYIYSSKMGLDTYKTDYYGIIGWDFKDRSVIDIGGSGQSILLKSKAKRKVVLDPILPSDWMMLRYKEAGIKFIQQKGEKFKSKEIYDIGIIYNVLQHTQDVQKILTNMKSYCRIIHIFEWIDQGISPGHIQDLKEDKLNEWLGGQGKVEHLTQQPAVGKAYYGIFPTPLYEA